MRFMATSRSCVAPAARVIVVTASSGITNSEDMFAAGRIRARRECANRRRRSVFQRDTLMKREGDLLQAASNHHRATRVVEEEKRKAHALGKATTAGRLKAAEINADVAGMFFLDAYAKFCQNLEGAE